MKAIKKSRERIVYSTQYRQPQPREKININKIRATYLLHNYYVLCHAFGEWKLKNTRCWMKSGITAAQKADVRFCAAKGKATGGFAREFRCRDAPWH